jgi:hypothetical protein
MRPTLEGLVPYITTLTKEWFLIVYCALFINISLQDFMAYILKNEFAV